MTIVRGLRIISSNAQTGTTWWNWTPNESKWQTFTKGTSFEVPKNASFKLKV